MNNINKRKELTEKDRYLIEQCLKAKHSNASIAELLVVSVKTIIREVHRGSIELKDDLLRLYTTYSAYYAHERHKESGHHRGRKAFCAHHEGLIEHIRDKLRQKWSPDAIIGSLHLEGEHTVCTKTVYNWLQCGYIEGFKLQRRQRKVSKTRVSYKNSTAKRIDGRSVEASERQPGHWEMDLVVSGQSGSGSLLVLTERASRSELIYLLKDKKQTSVIEILNRLERRYKWRFREIFKTIICDNGSEFLDCEGLDGGKRTEIYYAHPYSSWERGSNENANKLIRKFIKKSENISKLPVAYIKRIEKWMNNYPRRIFGYKTANGIRIA